MLRSLLREKVAPRAVEVVGKSEDPNIHLLAVRTFARVSGEEADEVSVVSDDVRQRLMQTVALITKTLPAEQAEPLLAELERIWT